MGDVSKEAQDLVFRILEPNAAIRISVHKDPLLCIP